MSDPISGGPVKCCANCKHWGKQEEADQLEPDFRYCDRAASEDGNPLDVATLAYARDNESCSANLATHPDFVCSMWKAKG